MVRRALHGKNRFASYLLLSCDSRTGAYIASGI